MVAICKFRSRHHRCRKKPHHLAKSAVQSHHGHCQAIASSKCCLGHGVGGKRHVYHFSKVSKNLVYKPGSLQINKLHLQTLFWKSLRKRHWKQNSACEVRGSKSSKCPAHRKWPRSWRHVFSLLALQSGSDWKNSSQESCDWKYQYGRSIWTAGLMSVYYIQKRM